MLILTSMVSNDSPHLSLTKINGAFMCRHGDKQSYCYFQIIFMDYASQIMESMARFYNIHVSYIFAFPIEF